LSEEGGPPKAQQPKTKNTAPKNIVPKGIVPDSTAKGSAAKPKQEGQKPAKQIGAGKDSSPAGQTKSSQKAEPSPTPASTTPPIRPAAGAAPAASAPNRQAAQKADEVFATCLACHGPNGQSETPEIPSLAGQPGPYITAQLAGLRDGKRKIPAMEAVTGQLTDENLHRFADTIEKLPTPPAPTTGYDAKLYDTGRALAAAANCASCHNNGFVGAGTNPSLVHQREDYLIKALRDYKSAARTDQGSIMAASVRNLDDAQMVALAHFLAHLR